MMKMKRNNDSLLADFAVLRAVLAAWFHNTFLMSIKDVAKRENMNVFSTVFLITLLVGIFVRQLFLPYLLPAMHAGLGFMAGDSIGYHEFAAEIAERIRSEGWGAWQLRPESEIFTLAAPSGIASAIYATFGTNPLYLLPFNAAVHAASAVFLFRMFQTLFEDKRVSLISTLPFIFFPTAISWHSQLLKDGVFILGIYAYLASWVMLARFDIFTISGFFVKLLICSIGLWIIWVVRPYMLFVLASITITFSLFLCLWILAVRQYKHERIVHIASVVIFACSVSAVTALISKGDIRPGMGEWTGQEFNSSVYAGRSTSNISVAGAKSTYEIRACPSWTDSPLVPIALSRLALKIVIARGGFYDELYTSSGSTMDREVCLTSFNSLIAYLPRALALGLLAPFPNQWIKSDSHGGGVSRIIVGFEMLLSYVALLAFIFYGKQFYIRPEFWLLAGFAVSMIVLYAFVVPNLGALHRMRYGFLMVIVGMGVGSGLSSFRLNKS